MRSFIACTLLQVHIIRMIQVKEDEMGRTCGTNGGEEECVYDIGGEARR
jgi:hypothetical protein